MDEEVGDSLPNHRLGCFVKYNDNIVDAIMIREGSQMIKSDTITIPLVDGVPGTDPNVSIICKDIQNDEPYAGSVSISRSILLEGKVDQVYTQWVTLFDDQDDDNYDGALGLNDDEEPRIKFEFTIITAEDSPKKTRKSAVERKKEIAEKKQLEA